jgi:hypothetical protein
MRSLPGSRPRLGDAAKRPEVDLGVHRRSRQIPVSQHLADLRQRCSLTEHLGGQRMAEPVRTHDRLSGSLTGTADHAANRSRVQTS